jgi:hypothetical protein
MLVDECESYTDSLAKKAVAFFWFNWLKNAQRVEKGGHADSPWSYDKQPPGERPACPRAYFIMRSGFESTGT